MAFRVTSERRGGKGKVLTPKMRSFLIAYFGDAKFNATEAIKLSDYECKTPDSIRQTAAQLLRHPLIMAEIDKRMVAREEKAELKAEYLIQKLMQIIEATESDNPNAALRAIELAGKSIALWKDRQEISGPDGGAIEHEQKVKEDVADFTSRIASLAKRNGTSNVVEFPGREDTGGA